MATYIELQRQIEALQKEAEAIRAKERDGVIDRMKEAISVYDITAQELGLSSRRGRARSTASPTRASSRKKTPAKRRESAYADKNGNTWGGRGPRPAWLKEALAGGARLEDFATAHGR